MADTYRIVKCPNCGKDKWAYMGGDLDYEPPCADCQRNHVHAKSCAYWKPMHGAHDCTCGIPVREDEI